MLNTLTVQPSLGTILVVDDLPQNLRLLASTLTEHGYEVRLAPDGVLALSSAFRFPPDLILLDINMPDMDGYEVCQQLKTSEPTREIPVIFLSAYDEPLDKQKAFEVGGVDYITKPFQVEEALIRIQHHLLIHKLKQQIVEQRNQLQAQNEQLQHEIQERIKAEEEAKEALQIKNKFLAKMSHNLRNPLSTILDLAQILQEKLDLKNEDKKRYLLMIEESGNHLLKLIDDILEISQVESGCTILNQNKINIYKLINSLNDMFSLKARQKGLQLIFNISPDVPIDICTDEHKLKVILINLLNNALKFTKIGQIILSISLDSEKAEVCFCVSDTGVGIAPEEMNELFKAFVQTSTGVQLGQGTGLGLAISQKFTHLLGGEIKVRSTLGQGTTFEFNLPITDD